ncbi:MAG TPA: hypothetical protein PKY25_02520 [Bacilli bacterium]|nr:hypothetical protein [Bacilli bacterium]
MNNNVNYIIKEKKEKSFYYYIFETLLTGFLIFIIINIVIGLISFMLVLNEKEPLFYTRISNYSYKDGSITNNVKVYHNFLYKIVIVRTATNKTINIKLWFSVDVKKE